MIEYISIGIVIVLLLCIYRCAMYEREFIPLHAQPPP